MRSIGTWTTTRASSDAGGTSACLSRYLSSSPSHWIWFRERSESSRRFEDESTNALVGNFLQATFAWLMMFGSIGLCRRLLSRESKTLRYISDSSYWLYLIHLPLVILAQWLVRDLQFPAFLKFAGITIVISAFLLITYEYGVRYTPIGRLLNGPRTRTARLS